MGPAGGARRHGQGGAMMRGDEMWPARAIATEVGSAGGGPRIESWGPDVPVWRGFRRGAGSRPEPGGPGRCRSGVSRRRRRGLVSAGGGPRVFACSGVAAGREGGLAWFAALALVGALVVVTPGLAGERA